MLKWKFSFCLLLFCDAFISQTLQEYELKLISKLENVHFEKNYDKAMQLNEEFKNVLEEAISNSEIFNYPLDSLSKFMSTEISPDGNFRIFNWNIELSNQKQYYECWILMKNLTILKLNDFKNEIPEIEYASLDANSWFGALYYSIIPKKRKNKTVYTLLGWDGNNMFSNKKIIESMTISKKNKIQFGIPIFKYPDGKIKKRVIFQYSKQSYMSLKHRQVRKQDYLIFDHLMPPSPNLKEFADWYVTDLSFDAFQWNENQWDFKRDFDAKSLKVFKRPFNDPNK
jgi:hypothetical protein